MVLVSASSLQKDFGERSLFGGVSFDISDRDRVGLVGANGAGKSTLFRILTGEYKPDGGTLALSRTAKIGYMEQYIVEDSDRSAFEEMLTVFSSLMEEERALKRIASEIDSASGSRLEALVEEQTARTERFQERGGLTYRSRARAAMLGLGFSEEDFEKPIRILSGGQRSRLALARLLVSEVNLLLLDEPTNHLDIEAIGWLEEFLNNFSGAAVIISHDRYFLDRVTTRTFELENRKLTVFGGNYSNWLVKKEELRAQELHRYKNAVAEIDRMQSSIDKLKQFNREKSIKRAESKEKMLARMVGALEKPEEELKTLQFQFPVTAVSGEEVLKAENLRKAFGSKVLFDHASMDIRRGERVFLLGPNGCGKTTLLKMLVAGGYGIRIGANVRVGYYDQTVSHLSPHKTVLDEVWDAYPRLTQTEVRSRLAAFLFRGEDVFKKIEVLSGGERARISLLKLLLSGANLLLLDEPTNHLDIYSMEALEDALELYGGTLLMVSHDRYFINKLSDRIYYMTDGGLVEFDGDYDRFLASGAVQAKKAAPAEPKKPAANEYQKRKEEASRLRRQKTRLRRLEEEIAETEQRAEELNALLQGEAASDYERLMQYTGELEEANGRLEALVEEWTLLGEALEQAEEAGNL